MELDEDRPAHKLVGTVLFGGAAFAVYSSDPSFTDERLLQLLSRLDAGGVGILGPGVRLVIVGEKPAPEDMEELTRAY